MVQLLMRYTPLVREESGNGEQLNGGGS
jgi:hypothetical protein